MGAFTKPPEMSIFILQNDCLRQLEKSQWHWFVGIFKCLAIMMQNFEFVCWDWSCSRGISWTLVLCVGKPWIHWTFNSIPIPAISKLWQGRSRNCKTRTEADRKSGKLLSRGDPSKTSTPPLLETPPDLWQRQSRPFQGILRWEWESFF